MSPATLTCKTWLAKNAHHMTAHITPDESALIIHLQHLHELCNGLHTCLSLLNDENPHHSGIKHLLTPLALDMQNTLNRMDKHI